MALLVTVLSKREDLQQASSSSSSPIALNSSSESHQTSGSSVTSSGKGKYFLTFLVQCSDIECEEVTSHTASSIKLSNLRIKKSLDLFHVYPYPPTSYCKTSFLLLSVFVQFRNSFIYHFLNFNLKVKGYRCPSCRLLSPPPDPHPAVLLPELTCDLCQSISVAE